VLDSAAKLFAFQGYAGTTMQAIAERARVSVETVYAQGSKSSLLLACVDRAFVGDDEPVPFLDRHPLADALASENQPMIATGFALALAGLAKRASRILLAFEQGAASDPTLAELWDTYETRRRQDFERVVTAARKVGPLPHRRSVGEAVDAMWSLASPQATASLLLRCQWSEAELGDLLTELGFALLVGPPRKPIGSRKPPARKTPTRKTTTREPTTRKPTANGKQAQR
jgi:AcrR family transcriptional regulator